jgi:hypothetical protein
MSAHQNLIIYAGQGFDATTCQWTWRETVGGPPFDLTGYSARAMIRPTLTDVATPLADWTAANGKIVLGGAAGTIALIVPASETSALWSDTLPQYGPINGRAAYRLGFWDLELVPPTAAVRRLMQGEVFILPEVTR